MLKPIFVAITVAFLVSMAGQAKARDANAMNAAFNQPMNMQMQAMTNNIVNTNMRAPHVQQQYRIYE